MQKKMPQSRTCRESCWWVGGEFEEEGRNAFNTRQRKKKKRVMIYHETIPSVTDNEFTCVCRLGGREVLNVHGSMHSSSFKVPRRIVYYARWSKARARLRMRLVLGLKASRVVCEETVIPTRLCLAIMCLLGGMTTLAALCLGKRDFAAWYHRSEATLNNCWIMSVEHVPYFSGMFNIFLIKVVSIYRKIYLLE